MGILVHRAQREVGTDVAEHEREKGDPDKGALHARGRIRKPHQHSVAPARPDQRHHRLQQPKRQRQHEGVMAELGNYLGRLVLKPKPLTLCRAK